MRSRLFSALILPVVLIAVPAYADDSNPLGNAAHGGGHAESTGSSFVATSTAYVDSDGHAHPLRPGTRDDAPSLYEYRVGQVFSGMCPDDAQGRPVGLVFLDERLISDGPTGTWTLGPVYCASPGAQPIDLGNIAGQAATVTESLTPPTPRVRVQPGGTTLVGNPTVFSGSDLADVTPPALTNPLSGRSLQLTVQPTTWTWDFGDGSPVVTTDGPPPAYEHGSSNQDLLTHTYRRAGTVSVRVTVTWTASYTVSGIAGARNVANPVASTTLVALTVRQARSQLVSH
jgi:hypothetical protein